MTPSNLKTERERLSLAARQEAFKTTLAFDPLVSYMLCVYPTSFVLGFLAGYTAKASIGYMIAEHLDNPIHAVIAILSGITSAVLASVITYALHRRLWTEGPVSPQYSN
jgi:hypothetical protein